jgi:hypothetical protein
MAVLSASLVLERMAPAQRPSWRLRIVPGRCRHAHRVDAMATIIGIAYAADVELRRHAASDA